jgi:hypothetical protein
LGKVHRKIPIQLTFSHYRISTTTRNYQPIDWLWFGIGLAIVLLVWWLGK